jgi:hypothetical protein
MRSPERASPCEASVSQSTVRVFCNVTTSAAVTLAGKLKLTPGVIDQVDKWRSQNMYFMAAVAA